MAKSYPLPFSYICIKENIFILFITVKLLQIQYYRENKNQNAITKNKIVVLENMKLYL